MTNIVLDEQLQKALQKLEWKKFTAVQEQSIPLALEGKDLRVTARTGSGKTAAFLLPILHDLIVNPDAKAGTLALILLPTRELARQTLLQIKQFSEFSSVQGEMVIGGEDFKVQASRIRKNPEIILGTPGRLIEQLQAGNIDFDDVRWLVLDEADQMLDMGMGDDVIQLAQLCTNNPQTLLFSATRGGKALQEVVASVLTNAEELRLDSVRGLQTDTVQQVIPADDKAHKERMLQWLLAHETFDKTIVFTNTREQADRLGGVIRSQKLNAFVLHGEKTQRERKLALGRFREGSAKVLIATDVAARGLDITGLDLVVNFDMPRSGDDYAHRIGRTGREETIQGKAISLVTREEWNLMSSVERYLRQQFERRLLKEVPGDFKGPKKVKSSGKAVGPKKKKTKNAKGKTAAKRKGGKRKPLPTTNDGLAKPKRVRRDSNEQ